MPSSDFIKNVGEVDFEYEVIAYSNTLPVLVYFWADWCKPCHEVEPLLQRLAIESMGSFRLAKVDVDSNPNLAIRYNVRTLPTIKAIVQENVSGDLVGPQPDFRIRDFIQNLTPPSRFILDIEKSNSLMSAKNWQKAESVFRRVLDEEPANSTALLGLVKSIIPQGKVKEAMNILEAFPASREYASAIEIMPLVEEMADDFNGTSSDPDNLLPAYQNSLALVKRGNLPAAIDGMLEILRTSKNYRKGRARLVVLALLEIMGKDDPFTGEYRSELASIIF